MTTALTEDPVEYLRRIGESEADQFDIADAALMLAALDHAGRPLAPYRAHLDEIAREARSEARMSLTAADGAHALAALLAGRYGYEGDRLAYDAPQNADLISVIDRRRGLPVALGILYLHAARAAGFGAVGLNAPGHFLLQIELRSDEALIDPFNGGTALERERLGAPPAMAQALPDLSSAVSPVRDLDVLLRLQNNLKLRAVQAGDQARALEIAKRMVLLGPRRPELWIDLGRLNEAIGALGAAQRAFEACVALVPSGHVLHNEAVLSLHTLKRRLN